MIAIVLVALFPVHSFNTLHKNRRRLKQKRFQEKFNTLIVDLDTRRPMAFHFYAVFFFRRIVFVIALVVMTTQPKVQLAFLLFQSVAVSHWANNVRKMVVNLLLVRPYVDTLSMTLSVVNELFLLLILSTASKFIDPMMDGYESARLGSACMAITVTLIFVNWALIIGFSVYRYRKKKRTQAEASRSKDVSIS